MLDAILGAGAAIGGAIMGSNSADQAADAGTSAARQQTWFQREAMNTGIALNTPQRMAGYTALAGLMDMAGLSRQGAMPGVTPTPGSPTGENANVPPGQAGNVRSDLQNIKPGRYYAPKPAEFTTPGNAAPEGWTGSDQDWINFQNMYYDDHNGFVQLNKKLSGRLDSNGQWHSASKANFQFEDYIKNAQRDPVTGAAGVEQMKNQYGVPDLAGMPAYNWQMDPGYQFRQQQQQAAIQNSAFARGGGLSGGTANAIMQRSGDLASAEYQNVFNRLASIAGYGQTATNNTQQAVQQGATGMSDAAGMAGAYRASGQMQQGNYWANAINQIGTLAGSYDWGGGSSGSGGPAAINQSNRYGR